MKHEIPRTALLAAALAMAFSACGGQDAAPVEGGIAGDPAGDFAGGQAQAWPQPPVDGGAQGPDGMLANAPGNDGNAAPPLPQMDTSRMQPARIMDTNGFAQPMVAAELQVPAGWQTVGGITWNDATNCIANQLQIGWTAMAPDSLTALEILPGFNWQVAGTEIQMNPCPAAPFRSTREFLESTVQKTRPGARVLDYQRLPEVERKMAQQGQANPQAQVKHDAGRLLIAYTKDGVEMREMLSATVSFSQMQGNTVGGTATIFSQRAPNGRLDFELTQRIADTMRANPQWMEAMKQRSMANLQRYSQAQSNSINDWHNRQMAIINARGAADRHAIRMRTNQEVANIYSQTVAHTNATNDRMHAKNIAGINEVNNYVGVDGNRVTSSIHGGSQVFQNTNDPNQAFSTDAPYPNPPDGYVELQQEP